MTKFGRFLMFIIILAIIIGAAYFGVRSLVDSKKRSEQVSQTISEQIATSSANQERQMRYVSLIPTATTTTPISWQAHDYPELGFTIAFPANLVARREASSVVLAFPKDPYFHWPLQDDARIMITTTSSSVDGFCAVEPEVPISSNIATTSFSQNGYSFNAQEGNDAAAGNRYHGIIYDTEGADACYRLSLFVHGSADASLYVGDAALIDKYNDQHVTDVANVGAIFLSIANSFRIDK